MKEITTHYNRLSSCLSEIDEMLIYTVDQKNYNKTYMLSFISVKYRLQQQGVKKTIHMATYNDINILLSC